MPKPNDTCQMKKSCIVITLSTALTLTSHAAFARCQGMLVLMALHDNYRATLNTTGVAQRSAASSVLVAVGGISAERFVARVAETGTEIDEDRLQTVLQDAERLAALALIAGADDPDFRHGRNLEWLADQVAMSRCKPATQGFDYGPA